MFFAENLHSMIPDLPKLAWKDVACTDEEGMVEVKLLNLDDKQKLHIKEIFDSKVSTYKTRQLYSKT